MEKIEIIRMTSTEFKHLIYGLIMGFVAGFLFGGFYVIYGAIR